MVELGHVVEQGIEVEVGHMEEGGKADEEAAEHIAPADQASKKPRIDEETSGSKSPPHIILAPSDRLQEIVVCVENSHFCVFCKYSDHAGSSGKFEGGE